MRRGNGAITILLADDDEDDRLMIGGALRDVHMHGELRCVVDGVDLLAYLRREGRYAPPADCPRPELILLDLKMPRMNGREALAAIKRDPALRAIPVVALTTSRNEDDVAEAYSLGVCSFISKPVSYLGLVDAMRIFSYYWTQVVDLPSQRVYA